MTSTTISPARKTLIDEVREYAAARYEEGGWDVIVECWSDQDLHETLGSAYTLTGAVKKVARIVEVFADRQADAINSAF